MLLLTNSPNILEIIEDTCSYYTAVLTELFASLTWPITLHIVRPVVSLLHDQLF